MVDPGDADVKVSNTATLCAKVLSVCESFCQVLKVFRTTQINFDKMLTDSTLYQIKTDVWVVFREIFQVFSHFMSINMVTTC